MKKDFLESSALELGYFVTIAAPQFMSGLLLFPAFQFFEKSSFD